MLVLSGVVEFAGDETMTMSNRKLRGFLISDHMLGEFCRNGPRSFCVNGPVPDTAKFWSAHFDHEKNAFVCFFEDESFDSVPEGCIIPVFPGPVIETKKP
jgi:hypothetical protein